MTLADKIAEAFAAAIIVTVVFIVSFWPVAAVMALAYIWTPWIAAAWPFPLWLWLRFMAHRFGWVIDADLLTGRF